MVNVKLLNKLQNTKTLYVILLFPIVGILLFSAIRVKDEAYFVGEITQVEQLIKLTTQISALIHETQKERGHTSIYMSSQGRNNVEELQAQYQHTDRLITSVSSRLKVFNEQSERRYFSKSLADIMIEFERISFVRQQAILLDASVLATIDYFSGLNKQLLNIISVLPNLSNNSNISQLSNTHLNILKGKEKADLERAVISSILSLDTVSLTQYLQAITLSAEQKVYFKSFTLAKNTPYITLFEHINNSVAAQRIAVIRSYVYQQFFNNQQLGNPKDLSINLKGDILVLQWFTASTDRINSLKNIEDVITDDLLKLAQQTRTDAFYGLFFYSILVFMAMAMALVIPIIFKQLQRNKKKLDQNINELNLTRDELLASEKIAALGRMVAGFAHEVNTPLGIAIGSVSQVQQIQRNLMELLAQDEVEEQDLLDNINVIETVSSLAFSNLSRAARLVQSFKRTSVDQVSEKSRRYKVKEVLEDVVFTLTSQLKKKAINVELYCPDELNIFGQPGRFDQLITNLIINSFAHGFTDDFTNKVHHPLIQIEIDSTKNNLIRLIYTDNGKGMTPSTLDKIFEPFFTTSRTDGTGLGMYLCHNIVVSDMHGQIRCQSRLGQGVVFEIVFPCEAVLGLENES